jgi:hypothetical protein
MKGVRVALCVVVPLSMAAAARAQNTPLNYLGGELQPWNFQAVFWGPNVRSDVQTGIAASIQRIVNAPNLAALAEYDVPPFGPIETSTAASNALSITASPLLNGFTLDGTLIGQELANQIRDGALPVPYPQFPGPNTWTVFVVFLPPDVTMSIPAGPDGKGQACAAHYTEFPSSELGLGAEVFPFIVVRDITEASAANSLCDMPVGFTPYQWTTRYTFHEIVETLTDPMNPAGLVDGTTNALPGWADASNQEIADKCMYGASTILGRDGVRDVTQLEYLDQGNPSFPQGGCYTGQDGASIGVASTFGGGISAFWSTYQGNGTVIPGTPIGGISENVFGSLFHVPGRPSVGWHSATPVKSYFAYPGAPITPVATFNDSSVKAFWAYADGVHEATYLARGQGCPAAWSTLPSNANLDLVPYFQNNPTAEPVPPTAVISAVNPQFFGGSMVMYFWVGKAGDVWANVEVQDASRSSGCVVPESGGTSWSMVARGAVPGSPVAAVSENPFNVHLFWADVQGQIQAADFCFFCWLLPLLGFPQLGLPQWTTYTLESGANAPVGSPVAAVATGPENYSIFWTTPNGGIFSKSSTAGTWTPGINQGGALIYGDGPLGGGFIYPGQTLAAVSPSAGAIGLAWTALDATIAAGQPVIKFGLLDPACGTGSGWSPAVNIGTTTSDGSNPAVNPNTLVSAVNDQGYQQMSVFWEGPGGNVLTVSTDNVCTGFGRAESIVGAGQNQSAVP